ncbi:FadR/GntR family transcriptional regulator [Cupriavidus sp. D384]|uniref:FadR/GntR family transcriptional regulator n=1 Tax=Cupriavidus sp. D384 TaxID=1538095 RepID=UPI000AE9677A|nr:FadR/GntR family transcriptional regulator [Cupriavidus sp. D384]
MEDIVLTASDATSRSEQVCKLIIAAILRGEFAADQKLPTEVDLANRYAVSRTTVREALSRLRSEGIVVSRRGSGSFVQRMPVRSQASASPQIQSIADIQHYYAFRLCVEVGAAEIAAQMRTDADLDTIRAAYGALDRTQESGAMGVEEDLQLHLAIARASHNPFFVSTIEHALGPIRQCMELARNLGQARVAARFDVVQAEHRAIIDAIAERSPIQAAEAMRRHIDNAQRRIFLGD